MVEFLTAEEKTYIAEVTIGTSTTTEDQTGDIVEEKRVEKPFSNEEILAVLNRLTGEIEQTPPMYSAVKINGKKLYEYAREGKIIDRPTRKITIHDIFLTSEMEYKKRIQRGHFFISSKMQQGNICENACRTNREMLGYPAHMSSLQRVSSGNFTLAQAISLEDLQALKEEERVEEILLPMEHALISLPKLEISDKVAEKVKNGAVLPLPDDFIHDEELFTIFHHGKCLAVYMKHPEKTGLMKPKKVFHL